VLFVVPFFSGHGEGERGKGKGERGKGKGERLNYLFLFPLTFNLFPCPALPCPLPCPHSP